jgi:hypothetical protein
MIGMLLRNWKFLLDIVIVLAVVVLIFLWNPFGNFWRGRKIKKYCQYGGRGQSDRSIGNC